MPRRPRRSRAVSLLVAAGFGAVFGLYGAWHGLSRKVALAADKPSYLHYDIVELRLTTRDKGLADRFLARPPRAAVTYQGEIVGTIAGIREVELKAAGPGVWSARWPVPWNAPAGDYIPVFLGPDDVKERVSNTPFKIGRRTPKPLPRGFTAVTLETVMPLASASVRGPDGVRKDWRGFLEWANELDADALWVLGGRTPGTNDGETWLSTNRAFFPRMAAEAHRRGLKFGIYLMYSLTLSATNTVPGYEYALDVKDGKPVPTRAVSIRDRKRLDDAVAFLKPFADDPNVDMLGLDYIRNALGGYELVDDFVAEMPGVVVPPEWPRLSRDERIVWLARKKIMRKDKNFVDAWQWWRAHRVALIVKEIKERLRTDKPLWAFTLTWQRGWHHGQDPVMMNDAGIDYDALMLYEADKEQYAQMMKDWSSYVRRGDVQLIPGNIIDWPLHQKDPEGPGEYSRRLKTAVNGVYMDGPARALFHHDLARLLWGRRGEWTVRRWADECKALSRWVKSLPEKKT